MKGDVFYDKSYVGDYTLKLNIGILFSDTFVS